MAKRKTVVPFHGTAEQEKALRELIAAHKQQQGALMPQPLSAMVTVSLSRAVRYSTATVMRAAPALTEFSAISRIFSESSCK